MARKKKSHSNLYWDMVTNQKLRAEYDAFLKREQLAASPDNAHIFAMRKINDGYRDMKERDLILLLAGDLPYMYD